MVGSNEREFEFSSTVIATMTFQMALNPPGGVRHCNRIGPQLRCELKSHVMPQPQRNSISPQHNGVLTATTATVLSNMSFHFRVSVFLCLNELSRR
ncbi:hypothetical protein A2U01_0009841 [Trifolium medium]|uniref:Uncharacterized protein n=1 Tax=Trifolium medium TaxID=97028 RepID=A0A392MQJ9_9FABA|nr:hypothetical protein [Trifolium medium]